MFLGFWSITTRLTAIEYHLTTIPRILWPLPPPTPPPYFPSQDHAALILVLMKEKSCKMECLFTSTQKQACWGRWGCDTLFSILIFPVCCWIFENPGLVPAVGCKYDLQWLAVTAAGSRCDSCSSCGSYCSAAGCRTIQYQVQGRTGLEKVKLKMQMVKNKTGLNIMFTSNAD